MKVEIKDNTVTEEVDFEKISLNEALAILQVRRIPAIIFMLYVFFVDYAPRAWLQQQHRDQYNSLALMSQEH